MPEEKSLPPISGLLAIVERLTKRMGRKYERATLDAPDGRKMPAILVYHGNKKILVRTEENAVLVTNVIQIGDDVRGKLKKLSKAEQDNAFLLLNQQLLSHGRAAYAFYPPTTKTISDIERIIVEETIYLPPKDSDIVAQNRYSDAIQEVVTVGARAAMIYGLAKSEPPETTTTADAPSGMYV